MWLWLLELPVENGYSVCSNIWEGVYLCCSWHKIDALGTTAVYTQTQAAALFPPHQHACHFWVSASVVLSFFHFHVCIYVERVCACWMYVGTCVQVCIWRPEVDVRIIHTYSSTLFIEAASLSQTHNPPICLVLLARLLWESLLHLLRLALQVGSSAFLAFIWVLGIWTLILMVWPSPQPTFSAEVIIVTPPVHNLMWTSSYLRASIWKWASTLFS